LLAAVVALAFWLRVVQVGESLWLDELHTAWVVADGAQQLAPRAAVGNQSPAYFALVWSLTKLAGASECCLRLPSVLAGVALVVSVYLVVARWTACSSAGLLAALLVAIDPNCVFYGQEARSYALVQLVGLLHVVLFGRLVWRPMAAKNVGTNGSHGTEGTGAGREAPFLRASRVSEELGFTSRLAWIATGVLLFYLHYTAILLVAAEVVYCGLSRFLVPGAAVHDGAADQQGYRWRQLAFDLTLLGLCLLPAVPHLREIAQRRQNWSSFVPARSLWRIWEIGDVFPLHIYLLAPLVVLMASWVSRRIRGSRGASAAGNRGLDLRWFLLALCWLLVPLTIAWVATVQGHAPLFFRRYLIVTAVAPIVWTALCYAACSPGFWRGMCALGVVSAVVFHGGMVRQWRQDGRVVGDRNQDWRSAVAYVREHAGGATPVFVRSGLVEAEHWYASEDLLRREFCLLPVLGLYRLDRPRDSLFPLPVSPPAVLSAEARRRVLASREAWCLVQGSEPSLVRFETSLRSVWRRSGAIPSSIQRRSFGSVAVFHVRVADVRRRSPDLAETADRRSRSMFGAGLPTSPKRPTAGLRGGIERTVAGPVERSGDRGATGASRNHARPSSLGAFPSRRAGHGAGPR